jgi:hypothetical protein
MLVPAGAPLSLRRVSDILQRHSFCQSPVSTRVYFGVLTRSPQIYRAGQLVEWQWRVLAAPCLLYFASFGAASLLRKPRELTDIFACAGFGIYGLIMFGTQDCRSAEGMPHDLVVTVSLTAVLNLILGGIIVYKLFGGRRAALAFLDRQVLAGRCARLAMFVIESALLWVIAAALHVGTAVPLGTAGIAPFFELLFEITTVQKRCFDLCNAY